MLQEAHELKQQQKYELANNKFHEAKDKFRSFALSKIAYQLEAI
ncbi:MAG: hypothetical protein O7C58_03425 [Rickettsia endosymbiont of Ixodes persulcatus]|nr:hypothetical protein [Rickettsia endosymbiont of Ixodes persulcatus]MCZ6902470.1 hypothetical protein [Rickettsia endosymbiont of Ixodes persulcatus]MCZ6903169.1 hypothetical protein [Rickettsia endosymbiont of Ixodes persulcatus]MCZ6908962.1 hypothetical protein [Rickettsia endosymbiont of Ixodes persulcatus]MCZ6924528.1 hypothetical protein [Rickettsia endosymbiont of Ixodes persulcatus]